MKSLILQRKAKDLLDTLNRIDNVTGETGHTLARYLCFIATQYPNPVGFADVGDELKITKSQVSRAARALHKLSYDGSEGLDMIDIHFDIHNPRIKLMSLNALGVASVERMVGV
jgi:DNA-binding MarR family transcriptional regulator